MAKAEIQTEVDVSAEKFFLAVSAYEDYPKFVDGCAGAEILDRTDEGARVRYQVSLMKDIEYVLKHEQDAAKGTMKWELVESSFVKKNTGSWTIHPLGTDRCAVSYAIEIEFTFPVPGFVLKKLIQASLPKMISNFGAFAQSA